MRWGQNILLFIINQRKNTLQYYIILRQVSESKQVRVKYLKRVKKENNSVLSLFPPFLPYANCLIKLKVLKTSNLTSCVTVKYLTFVDTTQFTYKIMES